MKDPYEVLGVSRNDSMDKIKAAYKELVKKYHPDKYQNNPLSGLAEEKLQEINEAYDYISKNHTGGSGRSGSYGSSGSYNSGGYNSSGSYSSGGGSTVELQQARQYLNMGNIMGAESVLNKCNVRNAEWFFLSGMVSQRKGWYDDAVNKVQTAVSMEPNNSEYRQAMTMLMNTGGSYRNTAYGRGYDNTNDMMCRLCSAYMCFDCLCDCI